MQQDTIHKIIDNIWNASAMRKNKTNFLARCKDTRDDREVKCEAISRIGSLKMLYF